MIGDFQIGEYQSSDQSVFESLNREWIEEFFWMEPIDEQVLRYPEQYILEKGGTIVTLKNNGKVIGVAALKRVSDDVLEFTKMALEKEFRGNGLGETLTKACVKKAQELGAKKVILYSSTKLKPAISLYRKLGFVEVPVDPIYKRSDIKMELNINGNISI